MKKKLLAILMSSIMATMLVGCNSNETEEANPGEDQVAEDQIGDGEVNDQE